VTLATAHGFGYSLFFCCCRCSSGSHGAGQSVTWTGVLNSRRLALGLKLDWAYSPGEVKVLTSSDGSNFEEAKCWQSSSRSEVAYEESIMFDAPMNVKAVTIAMRSPQSWGYYGINSAVLIAEPGPFMLVRWGAVVRGAFSLACALFSCQRRHVRHGGAVCRQHVGWHFVGILFGSDRCGRWP
jgi:hypothetical protein